MSEKQPYEQLYPHLFAPMRAGGTLFKNRVFAAPTHLPNTIDEHGFLTREGATYFGNFAKGGAAAVHLGEVILDHTNSLAHEDHLDMTSEVTLQSMNDFNEYCHVFGARTSVELNHSGHFAMPQFGDGSQPMSASAMHMPSGVDVRAMTEEDMDYVATIYAKAANMAKRSGCDMVLMHYGHGWLMGGFLSPLINKRTDKYGGSVENRMRFPRMVLERVRQVVGPDFTIECRINGEDAVPGGIVIADTVEYVKMIEDLVDLVHISAGNRLYPTTRAIMHPSHFLEEGHNVHLAETVKNSGVKIPVGAIGSIADPAFAESVIARGRADYVLMARSFVADPDWANKARAGRARDIRPCIQCFRCQDIAGGKKNTATHNLPEYLEAFPTATRRAECSVNPYHGNAMVKAFFPKPDCVKKVVVIGGGPAGMEGAMEAARAGHRVVLFEKSGELGGQMLYARHVWFKHNVEDFRKYLIRQLSLAGVDVRLNTEATPERVSLEMPDAVLVAVGAEPLIPPIANIGDAKVVPALDAIGREDTLGENVVLIGGGMVGCEVALHLAGTGKNVTLVEMGPMLAPDGIYTERLDTLKYMDDEPKLTYYTGTRCTRVCETGIEVEDGDGTRVIAADAIVLCAGMKPLAAERDKFTNIAFDTIPVGDCVKVASIKNAVSTAFDAVLRIGCGTGTNIPY